MLKGYAGDKIKKKLTITSLDEQPLKIMDITSTIEDKIKYKLKQFQKFYPDKKLIIAGCMPEAEYKECVKLFPSASLINTYHVTEIQSVVKNILRDKKLFLIGKRNLPCLLFTHYCLLLFSSLLITVYCLLPFTQPPLALT